MKFCNGKTRLCAGFLSCYTLSPRLIATILHAVYFSDERTQVEASADGKEQECNAFDYWERKLKDDALNPHVHRHLAYMLMKNATLGYKRTFPAALEHLETAVDWTH